MTDILKELFESTFYDEDEPTEKLKALNEKESALWAEVLPILGLDTVDEITNVQAAIAHEIDLDWFRQGFRLGASLMLELLD